MAVPKLSSINAQYVASPKPTEKQNQNNTPISQPKSDFVQTKDTSKTNKFSMASIILAASAAIISIFALINNKKTTGSLDELKPSIDKLLDKVETLTGNIADSAKTEVDRTNIVEKLNSLMAQLQTKIETLQKSIETKPADAADNKILERFEQLKETVNKYINKTLAKESEKALDSQNIEKTAQKATESIKDALSLNDINFKNGIATLKKDNAKFSGTITDTLKNGKNIQWKFKDGAIQEATTGDIKKTYFRSKNPYSKELVISTEDSGPIKTILKRSEQDGKITIKEYEKVEVDSEKIKLQTKHYEIEGKDYIKVPLKHIEERTEPKIYKGSIINNKAKEKLVSTDELQGTYDYAAFEDDGYKTFKLFIEKPEQFNSQQPQAEIEKYKLDQKLLNEIDRLINQPRV